MDKESERQIIEALSTLLPEAGFIAEEGSGSLTDEEYCWVIDPLDGTSNYIHDIALLREYRFKKSEGVIVRSSL